MQFNKDVAFHSIILNTQTFGDFVHDLKNTLLHVYKCTVMYITICKHGYIVLISGSPRVRTSLHVKDGKGILSTLSGRQTRKEDKQSEERTSE